MGRLTSEKVQSILQTFDQIKSYKETGEIEDVDSRVVQKYVELRGRRDRTKPQAVTKDIEATVPRAASSANPRTYEEIEPIAFEHFRHDVGPIELVTELRIPASWAKKAHLNFLQLKGQTEAVKVIKRLGPRIHQFIDAYEDMEREQVPPMQVKSVLRDVKAFSNLKWRNQQMKDELARQEDWKRRYPDWQKKVRKATEDTKLYKENARRAKDEWDSVISSGKAELQSVKNKISKLRGEDYRNLVKQTIDEFTQEKGPSVLFALTSVFDAARQDPENTAALITYSPETARAAGTSMWELQKRTYLASERIYDYYCQEAVAHAMRKTDQKYGYK